MRLCLDAGNSRLKFGLFDGGAWRMQGVHDPAALAALETRLPARPDEIVACNVAGDAAQRGIEALARSLAVPLHWLTGAATAGGVTNGYDHPERLGADRWAALIGARALHRGACVVVMAGTATTIDALAADGRFRGGLILPGLSMMGAALAANTAGLPLAAGRYQALPTDTEDAIASGAMHATLGAIARIRAALGGGVLCVLSGGAAQALAPHVDAPCRPVDNLVLEGLARHDPAA